MNNIDAFYDRLIDLFYEFKFGATEELLDGLLEFWQRNSFDEGFLADLKKRFTCLRDLSLSECLQLSEFEKLHGKDAAGLYSMKFKSHGNLRILFTLYRDGTYLLCCFCEKSGKRTTDYSRHIPRARQIIHDLKIDN